MPNTKVTKTVDGIKVSVDMRAFTDMRFMRLMTTLFKLDKEHDKAGEDGDTSKFSELSLEMMDRLDDVAAMLFGKDFEKVQNKVAAKNGGYISFQDWLTFISNVIEAYQKNANARPAPSGK